MNRIQKLSAAVALCAAGIFPARAETVVLNPNADTTVRFGANQNVNYGTATIYDIYQYNDARNYFAYVRFDLSTIPVDAVIDSATLTFTYNGGGTRGDSLTTGRFAVYGLLDVAGNTAQAWTETSLVFSGGTENVGAEYIANSGTAFDTTTRTTSFDGVGEFVTGTGVGSNAGLNSSGSLLAFLEARRTAGGFVTFIIDTPTAETGRGYGLGSREAASGIPTLSIDFTPAAVPEPSAFAAIAGLAGLGFAASRRRRAA